MDFQPFDTRHYPTLPVEAGYAEWAATYEDTVVDLMDLRLLERLTGIDWPAVAAAADFACGTGRIGRWLRDRGVAAVDGVDLTEAMLEQARAKGVYRLLMRGDVTATGLPAGAYGLVTMSLADEHLAALGPLYRETARLCRAGGHFVLVGYHPHFLMKGIATHFNSRSGAPVAIESHVHLMSDHVAAAHAAGFTLTEMTEGLVDDDWIARKPKWTALRSHPVSFAMVWEKRARYAGTSREPPPLAGGGGAHRVSDGRERGPASGDFHARIRAQTPPLTPPARGGESAPPQLT